MVRQRYFRKVFELPAILSPNVRFGMSQAAAGITPDDREVIPGVLRYKEYVRRRATWGKHEQCVGLDAKFDESGESLLFPPEWLILSQLYADTLEGKHRICRAIGIDPAEGGDKTTQSVIDDLGLVELTSKQTPDTSIITGECLAFMRKHNVKADMVAFDRGGGGKQHADRLRSQGFNVRAVGFGESISLDPKRGLTRVETRLENKEDRYVYKNRRAEMYGEASLMLEPVMVNGKLQSKFAIHRRETELLRQLSLMPKKYDGEGRLYLPPKNKPSDTSTEQTLIEIIGKSPDEADSFVLAIHAYLHKKVPTRAGAVVI